MLPYRGANAIILLALFLPVTPSPFNTAAGLFTAAKESAAGTLLAAKDNMWRLFQTCPLHRNALDDGYLEAVLADKDVGPETDCKIHGVIGQHIAIKAVTTAIVGHLKSTNAKKPLVLFFAGVPGVGKTFLEQLLRRHLFRDSDADGRCSGVLVISGADYREEVLPNGNSLMRLLRNRVANQIYKCPRSLIVIDEVQFMMADLLSSLVDFMGFNQPVDYAGYTALDFRKATFLLTSNTGSAVIHNVTLKALTTTPREALTYDIYAPFLQSILAKDDMMLAFKNRVDYYIPFLPMGLEQVAQGMHRFLQEYRCHGMRDKRFTDMLWDPAVPSFLARKIIPVSNPIPFSQDGLAYGDKPVLTLTVFQPLEAYLKLISGKVDQVTLRIINDKLAYSHTIIPKQEL